MLREGEESFWKDFSTKRNIISNDSEEHSIEQERWDDIIEIPQSKWSDLNKTELMQEVKTVENDWEARPTASREHDSHKGNQSKRSNQSISSESDEGKKSSSLRRHTSRLLMGDLNIGVGGGTGKKSRGRISRSRSRSKSRSRRSRFLFRSRSRSGSRSNSNHHILSWSEDDGNDLHIRLQQSIPIPLTKNGAEKEESSPVVHNEELGTKLAIIAYERPKHEADDITRVDRPVIALFKRGHWKRRMRIPGASARRMRTLYRTMISRVYRQRPCKVGNDENVSIQKKEKSRVRSSLKVSRTTEVAQDLIKTRILQDLILESKNYLCKASAYMQTDKREVTILTWKAFSLASEAEKVATDIWTDIDAGHRANEVDIRLELGGFTERIAEQEIRWRKQANFAFGINLWEIVTNRASEVAMLQQTRSSARETIQILESIGEISGLPPIVKAGIGSATSSLAKTRWESFGNENEYSSLSSLLLCFGNKECNTQALMGVEKKTLTEPMQDSEIHPSTLPIQQAMQHMLMNLSLPFAGTTHKHASLSLHEKDNHDFFKLDAGRKTDGGRYEMSLSSRSIVESLSTAVADQSLDRLCCSTSCIDDEWDLESLDDLACAEEYKQSAARTA